MFRNLRRRAAKNQFEAAFAQHLKDFAPPPFTDDQAEAAESKPPHDHNDEPAVYRLEVGDSWSIRDDGLAYRLGLRSNNDAEGRVQRALKSEDEALYSRIEFDSEADVFFAYAATQEDALALKAFILGMR